MSAPLLISSLKREHAHEGDWHAHARGQLFVIRKGLLILQTPHGASIMPTGRAGWLPTRMPHKAKHWGGVDGDTFYLAPKLCRSLPLQPCVFSPNPLLNEIMKRTISWKKQTKWHKTRMALLQVMIDELKEVKQQPLYLPMPSEKSLEKMANVFMQHPGITQNLEQWAKMCYKSKRTFTRHFKEQTGMSFAKWCQQVRIMHSLELLAQGKSVTAVSLALGYNSVSAFIKVFKTYLGETPAIHCLLPQNSLHFAKVTS